MKKQNLKKVSDQEIRDLVVQRLRSLSGNRKISIGESGEYTKDELVQGVKDGSKVGDKIIAIQINYLKSLKNGVFLNE